MNTSQENKALMILLLVAGLILLAPYMIRIASGNHFIIGPESYKNIWLQHNSRITFYDSYENRNVPINLLYIIPIHANTFSDTIFIIADIILGILTVLVAYAIMKKHNIGTRDIWAISILLITSPIFLYVFTGVNTYSVVLLLSAIAFLALITDKIIWSIIISVLLPFINMYAAIIMFIFFIIYFVATNNHKKNPKQHKIFWILFSIAILISILLNILLGYNPITHISIETSNIITDIGANIGFSFSMLILSLIGILLLLDRGLKNIIIYGVIFLMIIFSLFNEFIRIYLNFILVIFAGFALLYLLKRKWSISLIKKTTVLLIICSILFSSIFYITKLAKTGPDPEIVAGMEFIKKQPNDNSTILASADNTYMIEYFSGHKALIDPDTDDESVQMHLFNNITLSRNLEKTEANLMNNNIRYIVIDEDFRNYLERQEGLLFLIENSNKFAKVYENNKMEIWMHIP